MDFLKRAIEQIKAQLKNLTLSQKMVLALLMVIMAMAIFWMTQYSSRQEMVPLVNQQLSAEERTRIVNRLNQLNKEFVEEEGLIKVALTEHRDILGFLASEELLPADTSVGFNLLLEDVDVFTPEYVHNQKKVIALQMELASTIQHFPGVAKAKVFINEGNKRRLNNIRPIASASVSVETKSNHRQSINQMAASIATLVSGAVNQMQRENVTVVINGNHIPIAPEGEELTSEYIENLVSSEKRYREKILDILAIDNALVQVDLIVTRSKTETKTTRYLEEGDGTITLINNKTTREDSSQNSQANNEPGIVANNSEPAASPPGTSNSETSEESTLENENYAGRKDEFIFTPHGEIPKKDRTASISIPWDYFEGIAAIKLSKPQGQKPTFDEVEGIMTAEIANLKSRILPVLGLKETEYPDNVVVDYYWPDGLLSANLAGPAGMAGGPGSAAQAEAAMSVTGLFARYGKEIGVSALALISLFMALMMVRRASGPVEVTLEEKEELLQGEAPPDALSVEDGNIYDEGEDGGLLSGFELGEDAIRSQRILEQIRTLVTEQPEMAAKLLTKWIVKDD